MDHTSAQQTFIYLCMETAWAAIMGKTSDLTVVQKTIIDALHKEEKTQKIIAERAGCSQSTVSKHIHGNLTGRESVHKQQG